MVTLPADVLRLVARRLIGQEPPSDLYVPLDDGAQAICPRFLAMERQHRSAVIGCRIAAQVLADATLDVPVRRLFITSMRGLQAAHERFGADAALAAAIRVITIVGVDLSMPTVDQVESEGEEEEHECQGVAGSDLGRFCELVAACAGLQTLVLGCTLGQPWRGSGWHGEANASCRVFRVPATVVSVAAVEQSDQAIREIFFAPALKRLAIAEGLDEWTETAWFDHDMEQSSVPKLDAFSCDWGTIHSTMWDCFACGGGWEVYPDPAQLRTYDTPYADTRLQEPMWAEHDEIETLLHEAAGLRLRHLIARGLPDEFSSEVKWRPSLETIEIRVPDDATAE